MSGTSATRSWVEAVEYSGFTSGLDPLYSTGGGTSLGLGSVTATADTALTGTADAIDISTTVQQLGGTAAISADTPAWTTTFTVGSGFNGGSGAERTNNEAYAHFATWTSSSNNIRAVIAVFQDPVVFTAPRVTQVTQSIVGQLEEVPVFLTQVSQGLVAQGTERPFLTQVVRTLVVASPPIPPTPPEVPPEGKFHRWGLLRLDFKMREEEDS